MKLSGHVGLDFVDASDTRVFSFQILRNGMAIGNVLIEGAGKITSILLVDELTPRKASVVRLARRYFNKSKPYESRHNRSHQAAQ